MDSTDRWVCALHDLAVADQMIMSSYAKLRHKHPQLTAEQKQWWDKRNACPHLACIRDATEARFKKLTAMLLPEERVAAYAALSMACNWSSTPAMTMCRDMSMTGQQRQAIPQFSDNYCMGYDERNKKDVYTDLVCSSRLLVEAERKRVPAEHVYLDSLKGKNGEISEGVRHDYGERRGQWLAEKATCADVACLRQAYDAWLGFLSSASRPAAAPAFATLPLREDWRFWGLGFLLVLAVMIPHDGRVWWGLRRGIRRAFNAIGESLLPRDSRYPLWWVLGVSALWGVAVLWLLTLSATDIIEITSGARALTVAEHIKERHAHVLGLLLNLWALAGAVGLAAYPEVAPSAWADNLRLRWGLNAIVLVVGRVLGWWALFVVDRCLSLFMGAVPVWLLAVLTPVCLIPSGLLMLWLLLMLYYAGFYLVNSPQMLLHYLLGDIATTSENLRQNQAEVKRDMARFDAWLRGKTAADVARVRRGNRFRTADEIDWTTIPNDPRAWGFDPDNGSQGKK